MEQQTTGTKQHISSPEELHDYMRVTSPWLWVLLSAIVLALAGFVIYASTTTMENTLPIRVLITTMENTEEEIAEGMGPYSTFAYCELPLSMKDTVKMGMLVRIAGETGRVDWLATDTDDHLIISIQLDGGYVPLKNGEYEGEMVLEQTSPINFLWN